VRTQDGTNGWVWARNVELADATGETLTVSFDEDAGEDPCSGVETLEDCPPTGCARAGTPEALLHAMKRRVPPGTRSKLLSFADFRLLQQQADELVVPRRNLDSASRRRLKSLRVSSGAVSEGSLVRLVGYVTGRLRSTSAEAVNCNLPRQINQDYHVPIVEARDEDEFTSVVTEMIPQNRPLNWTRPKLRQLAGRDVLVMAEGQLFYDNKHVVNDDPASPIGGQPKRFTLWEIHPITTFYVCDRPDNDCDPRRKSEWTKLEFWTGE
jgi:hypothetical protein